MQLPPDVRESWIRDHLQPRYPELVLAYLDAIDIYDKAASDGLLPDASLHRLLMHAQSRRTPLGENAAVLLGQLYEQHPAVGGAIRTLANGRKLHERINALVALSSCVCGPLHVELLASALEDTSAKVRTLAADKIVQFRLRELVPELVAAIERESDPATKEELQTCSQWLLRGFAVRTEGDRVWVSCLTSTGTVGKHFAAAEFETLGQEWARTQLS